VSIGIPQHQGSECAGHDDRESSPR
jgi:hypothetical protein